MLTYAKNINVKKSMYSLVRVNISCMSCDTNKTNVYAILCHLLFGQCLRFQKTECYLGINKTIIKQEMLQKPVKSLEILCSS